MTYTRPGISRTGGAGPWPAPRIFLDLLRHAICHHGEVSSVPSIFTTTVGSYPVPDWLAALPSEQARLDATRVVFDIQRQAGIDLPTDGELYRFDVNHPDTNGMIEYFIRPMAGIRAQVGRSDHEAFARSNTMWFRRKAAGVVEAELGEGSLNLLADCELA